MEERRKREKKERKQRRKKENRKERDKGVERYVGMTTEKEV
jgi:hypothetical protein